MICKITSLAAIAIIVSPVTAITNLPAQAQLSSKNSSILIAQANQNITLPVEVTNISGLSRNIAGGHTAKVSYKVSNLPQGFSLKNIKIKLKVTLRDGEVQQGDKEISSNPNLQSTIEVKAPGRVLRADEETTKVEAIVTATAARNFNGFILGKVSPNNLSQIDKQSGNPSQFPLDVDITRLSNLERTVGGGHKIDVRYGVSNTPSGFSLSQVRVKAKFVLTDNSEQVQTDVLNNPNLAATVNVRATGSIGKDQEIKRIEIQVAADGIQRIIGTDTKTESATQAQS